MDQIMNLQRNNLGNKECFLTVLMKCLIKRNNVMDKVNVFNDHDDNVVNSINVEKDLSSDELNRHIILQYEDVISKQLHDFVKIHRDQIMTPMVW
jgi:hypothetical protein